MSEFLTQILDVFLKPGTVLIEAAGDNPEAIPYILVAALISLTCWLTMFVITRRIFSPRYRH